MAIKRTLKPDPSMSMSSMSDLVFLLLIFFMITSTMVSPNALKLLLPQSSNQVKAKPAITVSVRHGDQFYYVDGSTRPLTRAELESKLKLALFGVEDPTVSLHAEKTATMEEVVKVMNIAKDNRWKVILATSPEGRQ
ncbi:MAG: biopolymer transporter ExbD [Prevotellaceae bacterium]|jgi:biopolymer transport protein ExbD|nr:biopolymer transporter ExbD [Prevotellaceae bacterium]